MPRPNIFVRVWPSGNISFLCVHDRRAWPWEAAYFLACAKEFGARYENKRDYFLKKAEWIATHRRVFLRHRLATNWLQLQVTACDICGKHATNLSGYCGRCRVHRFVKDGHVVVKSVRGEKSHSELEKFINTESARDVSFRHLHDTKKSPGERR